MVAAGGAGPPGRAEIICHGRGATPGMTARGNIRAWGRASRAVRCLPPLITRPGPSELGRHDGPVDPVAVRADGRVVTGGATPRRWGGSPPARAPQSVRRPAPRLPWRTHRLGL